MPVKRTDSKRQPPSQPRDRRSASRFADWRNGRFRAVSDDCLQELRSCAEGLVPPIKLSAPLAALKQFGWRSCGKARLCIQALRSHCKGDRQRAGFTRVRPLGEESPRTDASFTPVRTWPGKPPVRPSSLKHGRDPASDCGRAAPAQVLRRSPRSVEVQRDVRSQSLCRPLADISIASKQSLISCPKRTIGSLEDAGRAINRFCDDGIPPSRGDASMTYEVNPAAIAAARLMSANTCATAC
jgi:hypothetical protein